MLSTKQKAAAWDKLPSQLTDEESLYVSDPVSYQYLEQGCFDIEKLGRMQHQSAWIDVERKAKVIVTSNRVSLIYKRPYDLNLPHEIIEVYGKIVGDHGSYEAKILIPHPKSRAIRSWSCACAWGRYAWDRRPIYKVDMRGRRKEVNKKFEGRVCSHILALWWTSMTRAVEYEDVDPSVMQRFFPELLEQDRLEGTDWDAMKEIVDEKQEPERRRISPRELEMLDGIDISVLNKALQDQFDLVSADQVVDEITRILNEIYETDPSDQNAISNLTQELQMLVNTRNVYDTEETEIYKKEIVARVAQMIGLDKEARELLTNRPTRFGPRLTPEQMNLYEQGQLEELPLGFYDADPEDVRRLREQGEPVPEYFWADRGEYTEKRQQIDQLKKEIRVRTNAIQEAYDANPDSDLFSKTKAQDLFRDFHWWEVNDKKRGRDFIQRYLKNKDPKVILKMIKERIKAAGPGGAWSQMQMPTTPIKQPVPIPADSVQPEPEAEQPAIEQPQESSLFDSLSDLFEDDNKKSSSVTILSSDIPIKDVVVYIQQELTGGRSPRGFVRKELWGEQRGGLVPHPDALPLKIRPDGNFIYSPDDLGYNPLTGEMGCEEEDRGTYGAISVGDEVVILFVDPRDRMVMIEYNLEEYSPNHSHIHLWIPLKDIDLI